MIEHRMPSSIEEFLNFYRRSLITQINPSSVFDIFDNDIIARPVDSEKIVKIKNSIFMFDEEKIQENCSICQEELKTGQNCVKLDCNHYFHTSEKDCCETGSIFKWFEANRVCPVCRKEIF